MSHDCITITKDILASVHHLALGRALSSKELPLTSWNCDVSAMNERDLPLTRGKHVRNRKIEATCAVELSAAPDGLGTGHQKKQFSSSTQRQVAQAAVDTLLSMQRLNAARLTSAVCTPTGCSCQCRFPFGAIRASTLAQCI